MLDLPVTNATLPDGRTGMDIACVSGLISEIALAIKGKAIKTIDAKGYLVSPPFIDSHFQMDATLSLGIPRLNMSGTLLEGIELWGNNRPLGSFRTHGVPKTRYSEFLTRNPLNNLLKRLATSAGFEPAT